MKHTIEVTREELSTILVALEYWRRDMLVIEGVDFVLDCAEIASGGWTHSPLDDTQVRALTTRLKTGASHGEVMGAADPGSEGAQGSFANQAG